MMWNDLFFTFGILIAIASGVFSIGLLIRIVAEEIERRKRFKKIERDVRRFYNGASEQRRNCETTGERSQTTGNCSQTTGNCSKTTDERCLTMTIEGETVEYTGKKTLAEICAEIEQKKAPRRLRHLAFCAKKFRVRKKNRARLKKYEREQHI